MRRATAFVAIGAIGFVVQFASLAVLTSRARWHWLPATLVSVELAVVHNFLWHERWTWRDRGNGAGGAIARFLKFNGGNGLTSLAGNTAVMAVLTGVLGVPAVAANLVAVAALAFVNFALADRWVFRRGRRRPLRAPAARVESAAPAIARAGSTRPRCGW